MSETVYFTVEQAYHKTRLDDYLFVQLPDLSRMYLRHLIAKHNCQVNGEVQNTGYRLSQNDFIEIQVDFRPEILSRPEKIDLDFVYEDTEILVINKPEGLLVHPTKGRREGTLLSGLHYYLNFNSLGTRKSADFIRVGLAHRLDQQTSGLMVIGKNERSHRILCSHFQKKIVEKKYYAVVEGNVKEKSGSIVASIGRNEIGRFWQISDQGRFAQSNYRLVKRGENSDLLELEPVTGRTNQLRLHCAHLGHPIVGDKLYQGRDFARLCLHAYKLGFWHPNGKKRLEFETDIPELFLLF